MAGAPIERRRLLGLAAVLLPLLAACGRKDSISVPEGAEASYRYPRTYPDPKTVVPQGQEPVLPPPPVDEAPAFGQENTTSKVIE